MSREAFGEEVLVYANLNNWGGRFITPGPFDNTSRIFFVSHASVAAMLGATQWSSSLAQWSCGQDWMEYGKLNGATLLWTEDWCAKRHAVVPHLMKPDP